MSNKNYKLVISTTLVVPVLIDPENYLRYFSDYMFSFVR